MRQRMLAAALVAALSFSGSVAGPSKWVSAYYAGWWQGGQLNPEEIDYSAVTHIIHFALVVNANGSFAGEGNGITPAASAAAVRAAHGAGRKILISAGGSNSDGGFAGAVADANREKFIAALIQFMNTYGYDGIDIDWEPVSSTSHYLDFIRELRAKMTAERPGSLLFTAVMTGTDGKLLAKVAPYFDQINLMTYDMSGPWPRWETWHNSPLYNGGAKFQSTGGPLPAIDDVVRDKIAAGVPAAKLGIGIDFYGYRWSGGDGTSTGGVTRPRQAWRVTPVVKDNVPYFTLMDAYSRYPVSWDADASAAYIGIDNPGSAKDEFISFDEERSIRAKAQYIAKTGLGGVILYELGGGYRKSLAPGYRDLLLQNVRYSFLGGKPPLKDDAPPALAILFPRDGARLSGTATFVADAKDNSSVAGVQFSVDGASLAAPSAQAPYTLKVNTWKFGNGNHELEVVAYDAFGNSSRARHSFTVANSGTMPAIPDNVVYDGALHPPFVNTSWGATVDFASRAVTRSSSGTAEVSFGPWGAFDLLSGTWGAETPIDPSEFDTLKAEIYPLSTMKLKIAYYNGVESEVSVNEGVWNSIAVPLNFSQPFTRFYFQSGLKKGVKCYFADIRFTAKTYRATAER